MTETPDEIAFWLAIGADPDDALPRLVLADWLEERAGVVACECPNAGMRDGTVRVSFGGVPVADMGLIVTFSCPTCDGTGFIPDGRADLAAAIRATADRVPLRDQPDDNFTWFRRGDQSGGIHPESDLPAAIYDRLSGKYVWGVCRAYPTAEAAIRDLVRAWVAVNTKRKVTA